MRKFILAVVVLALGFSGARAGDAKPVGKALTDDELLKMLENMGYEIMARPKEEDTAKWVVVKVASRDLPIDIPVTVRLSGDKSTVCFFVCLADLTDKELGNAERLRKLLELNDTGGKNQFRVNPKTKRLWMARVTDNAGMTPAALKRHLESLAGTVADTRDHWDTKKWAETEVTDKK